MTARRMAIPCVEKLGTVLIDDVGVPIPRIPDLIAAVEDVALRTATTIAVIGHAGDGNFHPLVVFDRHDAAATARAEEAFGAVMDAALSLGATDLRIMERLATAQDRRWAAMNQPVAR